MGRAGTVYRKGFCRQRRTGLYFSFLLRTCFHEERMKFGPGHGTEIPYVFDNLDRSLRTATATSDPETKRLPR